MIPVTAAPVRSMVLTDTMTSQVSVLFPSAVVTVMTEEPQARAVMLPSEATETTSGLLLDQVTAWLLASKGVTVASRKAVSSTYRSRLFLFRETPSTAVVTETGQEAWKPMWFEVAVIVAVPLPTASTTPDSVTVATDSSSDVQMICWSEASAGRTEADRAFVSPFSRTASVSSSEIPVTWTSFGAGLVIGIPQAVQCVISSPSES